MDERVEADLVRRAKGRDATAFDGLVRAYGTVVYNIALRMVGDREDARDLTQGIFLKAWEGIARIDEARRFFSWLYRIALNESLNHLRGRRPRTGLDEGMADPQPSPEERLFRQEQVRIVQAGLMELAPEDRQLLVLHYFAQLTYEEVSGLLEVPEKTIKSRLFLARQRLGRILKQRGLTSS